jgi:hypothetical protein
MNRVGSLGGHCLGIRCHLVEVDNSRRSYVGDPRHAGATHGWQGGLMTYLTRPGLAFLLRG